MSDSSIHKHFIDASLFSLEEKDLNVSFEFFPPKNAELEESLWKTMDRLAPLSPAFVSVTYGAGGSTRERTHNIVSKIAAEHDFPVAAHLTCVSATKEEVDAVAEDYWHAGVRSIVALRGDAPEGAGQYQPHPDGYQNAEDLVKGLRAMHDFDISVAAYPERHPDSPNLVADLDNLKRKIDAGANRAITQFFFDPDHYFRFMDHVTSMGIDVPIVPGILPVSNFKTLKRFADACGASIPPWMAHMFEGLDDDPKTRQLVAAMVAAEMVKRLEAGGVKDFHFYTLNRADLSYAICHMLGLRAKTSN